MSKQTSNRILTAAAWCFMPALVPSVLAHNPPSVSTSVITAAALCAVSFVYVRNRWLGAAASTGLTAALWAILLIQGLGA